MLPDFFYKFILSPAGIISLVPGSLFLWYIVKSVRYLRSLPQCTIEKARKTVIVAHEAKRNLVTYLVKWFSRTAFVIVIGGMGIAAGLSLVVSMIFNLFADNISTLRALLFLGVTVAMCPLAVKIIGIWEKQVKLASQQRS